MDRPARKPNRLRNYDYSQSGAYFVTVCTKDRKCILSDISVGAIHESPLQKRALIPKIIGYLRMNSSKEMHFHEPNLSVWQRSFHDHIIRNEEDYYKIREYIEYNACKWKEDCFYVSE